MRNITKWVNQGKRTIKDRRQLDAMELRQLTEIAEAVNDDSLYDAILTAFYFGFMVGYRQSKEEKAGE